MATRVEVEKCKKHRKWLCKSQGEKKTFYRALYRYKMNGYKGTRVPPFYSGFFWGLYDLCIAGKWGSY